MKCISFTRPSSERDDSGGVNTVTFHLPANGNIRNDREGCASIGTRDGASRSASGKAHSVTADVTIPDHGWNDMTKGETSAEIATNTGTVGEWGVVKVGV